MIKRRITLMILRIFSQEFQYYLGLKTVLYKCILSHDELYFVLVSLFLNIHFTAEFLS